MNPTTTKNLPKQTRAAPEEKHNGLIDTTRTRDQMRRYDIVIFGCTGNAGRATALKLIENADGQTKLALAGRNKSKVEALRKSVCAEINVPETRADIVIADASDKQSMLKMARDTHVLISCAGPYGRFGEASVTACIEGGANYVDITGEVTWVNQMINKHGQAAIDAGIVLLPFSGYDCVPAELAMIALAEEIGSRGASMESLELIFKSKGGGFPRGTLHTVLDQIEGKAPRRRKGQASFVPHGHKGRMKASLGLRQWLLPSWSSHSRRFTGPNFMSLVNAPVMYRAAAKNGIKPFSMRDSAAIGGGSALGLWGFIPTMVYILVLLLSGFLLLIPCFRWCLKRRLRSYSYGGNANALVTVKACASAVLNKRVVKHSMDLVIPGDPGIYATGLMASCVGLALFKATRPGLKCQLAAGFGSPAAALFPGGFLVDQLRKSGASMSLSSA